MALASRRIGRSGSGLPRRRRTTCRGAISRTPPPDPWPRRLPPRGPKRDSVDDDDAVQHHRLRHQRPCHVENGRRRRDRVPSERSFIGIRSPGGRSLLKAAERGRQPEDHAPPQRRRRGIRPGPQFRYGETNLTSRRSRHARIARRRWCDRGDGDGRASHPRRRRRWYRPCGPRSSRGRPLASRSRRRPEG